MTKESKTYREGLNKVYMIEWDSILGARNCQIGGGCLSKNCILMSSQGMFEHVS